MGLPKFDLPGVVVPSTLTEEQQAAAFDRRQRAALQAFGVGLRSVVHCFVVVQFQTPSRYETRTLHVSTWAGWVMADRYEDGFGLLLVRRHAHRNNDCEYEQKTRLAPSREGEIDTAVRLADAFLDAVAEELGR